MEEKTNSNYKPQVYVVENSRGKKKFLQATTDAEDAFIVETFPDVRLAKDFEQEEEAINRRERGREAPNLTGIGLDKEIFTNVGKESNIAPKSLKQQSLDRLTGQDIEDVQTEERKKAFVEKRSKNPMKVIGDDIERFTKKKQYIDEISNASPFPSQDEYIPTNVVEEIKSELSELQPETNGVVVDNNSRIPTLAYSWLWENKVPMTQKTYIPAYEGGPLNEFEKTEYITTQKQKNEVIDWLNNTELGQRVISQESKVMEGLNESIEELKVGIEEKFKQDRNSNDAKQAKKYLNELEKLQNAYNDKDRNAFVAGAKEFGRRFPYALGTTATIGIFDLISATKMYEALGEENNTLTQEGAQLLNFAQQAYSQDTTIAQSIAKGVTDTMPFIAEFAFAGKGVGAAAKQGAKAGMKGLAKLGVNTARLAGNTTALYNSSKIARAATHIVREPLSAGAKAFIMPSTLRNAVEESAPGGYGNFLDAFARNWGINTLSNLSENMGRYIPEPKFADKYGWTKKIADATGMQGVFGEFVEENIDTALQATFETGEGEWADLVDPRNQLVTLGVVVALQLPFASINMGGKAASATRNWKQQRSINKGYSTNVKNVNRIFGKELGTSVMEDIDNVIASIPTEQEMNDVLNAMLNDVAESSQLNYDAINAIRTYTQSAVARNGMLQAKEQEAHGRVTEITEQLAEMSNPDTGNIEQVQVFAEDDPFVVIGGTISTKENGDIDDKNTSDIIYVKNTRTGEVKSITKSLIKGLTDMMPLDIAVQEATNAIFAPLDEDFKNQQYYPEGRAVVFNGQDNQTYAGEIISFDESTGRYIVAETASMQPFEVEPRFIYPSPHLDDVQAGSEVVYTNNNGEEAIGILDQNITSRDMFEGFTYIDGMQVPLNMINGLHTPIRPQEQGGNSYSPNSRSPYTNFISDEYREQYENVQTRDALLQDPEFLNELRNSILQGFNNDIDSFNTFLDNKDQLHEFTLSERSNDPQFEGKYEDKTDWEFLDKLTKAIRQPIETETNTEVNTPTVDNTVVEEEQVAIDEQGNPDFYSASPITTAKFILEFLENDAIAASNFIAAQIKDAEAKDKKLKEPKTSTDIVQYQKEIKLFNTNKQDAQAKVEYWKSVAVQLANLVEVTDELAEVAVNSMKTDLLDKIIANSDLSTVDDAKAVSLITDIFNLRRGAAQGLYNLDTNELKSLVALESTLKSMGYSKAILTDVEAQDDIADVATQTTAKEAENADANTLLNYYTNEIEPAIIHNGQVIQRGLYDAEIRVSKEMKELQKKAEEDKKKAEIELEEMLAEKQKAFTAKAPVTLLDNYTDEDLSDVADNSKNPEEIFQAYYTALNRAEEANLQPWEKDLLGRRINPHSFTRFSDKNNITGTIARSWFSGKNKDGGYNNTTNLDIIAQELSDTHKMDITPQMIVDFVLDNPTNYIKRQNELTKALNDRFRQVVQGMYGLKNVNGIESNSAQNFMNNFIAIMNNPQLYSSEMQQELGQTKLSDKVTAVLREINFTELNSLEEAYEILDSIKERNFSGFPFNESDYNETIKYLTNAEQINQEAIQRWGESFNQIEDSSLSAEERTEQQPTPEEIIAYEESLVNLNPTDGQKEAGNYQKGHINIQGLDISIENPPGSIRSGKDANGKEWSVEMKYPYGYIKRTVGADGDHVDVVYGKNLNSDKVFIFNQLNEDGTFDEHKVVIAATNPLLAEHMMKANYNEGFFKADGPHQVTMSEFKEWLDNPENTNKPFVKNTKPFLRESEVKTPQTETKPPKSDKKQGKTETKTKTVEAKENTFGKDNKFITNDKAEELRERIRKRLGSALMSGFDPELVKDCVMLAAYYVEGGARSFKDYSTNMLKDLGVGILPMLKSVYSWAKLDESIPAEIRKSMDSLDAVSEIDMEKVLKDFREEQKQESLSNKFKVNKDQQEIEANILADWAHNNGHEAIINRSRTKFGDSTYIYVNTKGEAAASYKFRISDHGVTSQERIDTEDLVSDADMAIRIIEAEIEENIAKNKKLKEQSEKNKKDRKNYDDKWSEIKDDFKTKEFLSLKNTFQTPQDFKSKNKHAEDILVVEEDKKQGYDRYSYYYTADAKLTSFGERQRPNLEKPSELYLNYLYDLDKEKTPSTETTVEVQTDLFGNPIEVEQPPKSKNKKTTEGALLTVVAPEDAEEHERAEVPAVKELAKKMNTLSKNLAKDLNLEHEKLKNDKNLYSHTNVPPAGGEATIKLYKPNGEGIVVQLRYTPTPSETGMDNLQLTGVEYALKNRDAKHQGFNTVNKSDLKDGYSFDQLKDLISRNLKLNENEKQHTKPGSTSNNGSMVGDSAKDTSKPIQNGPEVSKKSNTQQDGTSSKLGEDGPKRNDEGGNTRGEDGNIQTGLPTGRESNTSNQPKPTKGDVAKPSNVKVVKRNTRNNKMKVSDYTFNMRGPKAKIDANIEAIKLANELTESGKEATPEQMKVLREYVGWGGLSNVFKPNDPMYNEVKAILSEEEYKEAFQSTTTAFYTPPQIVESLWKMVEKLGFKGGNVLEPSTGIGNIFSLMPTSLADRSNLSAVELDKMSGKILSLLYPDADVHIGGYETKNIKNNTQDVIITNVPFGQFKVYDSADKDISTKFNIHDYFIAKSIRKLKPGGIGVFITTTGTMDSSSRIREWLDTEGNADLIDAVRLNTDTFKSSAGTEVSSDILIFRKRDVNGKSPYAKEFKENRIIREVDFNYTDKKGKPQTSHHTVAVNKYFADNPNRMAGTMRLAFEDGRDGFRPFEQRLVANEIDQDKTIQDMIDELPTDVYNTTAVSQADGNVKAIKYNEESGYVKEGGLTIKDGQPHIRMGDDLIPIINTDKEVRQGVSFLTTPNKVKGYEKAEVLQDYLNLKEAVNNLLALENNNEATDKEVSDARKELNDVYDNFYKKHKQLTNTSTLHFLKSDIDYSTISAIENERRDKDNNVTGYDKSDIFKKRVINRYVEPKADNIKDAITISVIQNGSIDLARIAKLLDITEAEAKKQALEQGLAFVNPTNNALEDKNTYLSGNVREKLDIAEANNHSREFNSNITALLDVVPVNIPLDAISTKMGSTWIPVNIYNDYFKEKFEVNPNFYKSDNDRYISDLNGSGNPMDVTKGVNQEYPGSKLAYSALNGRSVTISKEDYDDNGKKIRVKDPALTAQANLKIEEINDDFSSWVRNLDDTRREQLEEEYNYQFNSLVKPTIDGSMIDRFPNASGNIVMLSPEGDLKRFRDVKEADKADIANTRKVAKDLGVKFDEKTGIYSTTDNKTSKEFMDAINGDAKILRDHQKEGVLRGLRGSTLLAHEVGTGKTLTLITTAMEMKRLGLANKPAIIVQKATLGQFVKEIKNQYPNARILVPSAKDLKASERENLYAKIAYNDWDIVVLYHSFLDAIPDDPERVAAYIDQMIKEKMDLLEDIKANAEGSGYIAAGLSKEIEALTNERSGLLNEDTEDNATSTKSERSVKATAKTISATESKVKALLDRKTDKTMNFEQLGIDALLIDEAHNYKKLGFQTGLQNIKGIDTKSSKKAQSTRLKTQYIKDNNNNRNVIFATGTPISNTMAEMWTFMRYLLPESEIERLDLNIFDSFVRNFGNIEEGAEFTTSGEFKLTNRFSSYANVPELLNIWEQAVHTVLTQEIATLRSGVGTPLLKNGKPTDVIIEQSKSLKQVMRSIKDKLAEYEKLSPKEKKEQKHIPLVMFGLAKRAAIDVRLVAPHLPEEENSKTNEAVRIVVDKLKETNDYRGTIAVFADSFNSRDKSFNLFDEIKKKLIEKGVPADEIAIIHDYETDDKKVKLFEKVNLGDIRVVIGNTDKLGVGVNIQQRLNTLIHLDAPIRPSDYQQRNGRIERQGNKHLEWGIPVEIIRIGVKQTLDTTGYQRLAIKENFIRQIMEGNKDVRLIEDEELEAGGGNFNETMAMLSGSTAALAILQVRSRLRRLESQKEQHENSVFAYKRNVGNAKNAIKASSIRLKQLKKHIAEVEKAFPNGEIKEITIGDKTAITAQEMQDLINEHIVNRFEAITKQVRDDKSTDAKATMTLPITINGVKGEFNATVEKVTKMSGHLFIPSIHRESTLDLGPTVDNPLHVINSNKDYEANKTQSLIDIYLGASPARLLERLNASVQNERYLEAVNSRENSIVKAQKVIDSQEHLIDEVFTKDEEIANLKEQVDALEKQIAAEIEEITAREKAEAAELGDIDIDLEVVEAKDDKDNDDSYHIDDRSFEKAEDKKIDALLTSLQKNGLALDVVIEQEVPDNVHEALKDDNGTVYGWVDKDGIIHLVEHLMNMNTPIHEFAHLWVNMLKRTNPEAYFHAKNMILNSPYWTKVNDMNSYKDAPFEQRIDEAIALAIGDYGSENFKLDRLSALKDIINRLFNSIKTMLGFKNQANFKNMTLDKFLNHAFNELTKEKELVKAEERAGLTNNDVIFENLGEDVTDYHRDMLDIKMNQFIIAFNKSKFVENYQDRFYPVKQMLDYLRENGVNIPEYNDWYLKATHLFGQVDHSIEMYDKNLNKPMLATVKKLIEAKNMEYRDIENYVLIKHAIERNEYFTNKALEEGTEPREDYSGLIPMLEEVDYESAEEYIKDFEEGHQQLTDELWDNIRNATNNSLKLLYDNGVIAKDVYDDLKARYKYYVPLRGHDQTTAEDRWEDIYSSQGSRFNDPLKKAKGRKSRAIAPFANIYNINQSAISEAHKNNLNQSLLRIAQHDKTGLITTSSVWYERVGQQEDGTPIYEIRTPEYSDNQETRTKNEEEFLAKMKELEEQKLAFNSRKKKVNVGNMFIKPSQAQEHQILIKQNGITNAVYINGNPRVAKAINGTNVVDKGNALSLLSNVTRFMASLFTTKNPKFILTNASRDFIMASSMLAVKEGPKYDAQFFKNIPNAFNALKRYNFGKPTMDNKFDRYFNEYLMNGAKTGYSHFIELKRLQRNIEKDLKSGTIDGNKKVMRRLGDIFGAANDMAENYTRLATYITSREMGRSIARSVSDAKEVTLNFNRRGAGGGGILSSNLLTSAFVFFNVGFQAIDNFARVARNNPKATTALIAGFVSAGFISPLINSLFIGDGDDDKDPMQTYFEIGEWERQNNFTMWTGNGFIKIPIAQELRVFYGMGDNLFLMATGRKEPLDAVLDQLMSFSDLVPNNPMGAITSSWAEMIPEPLKPLAQIAANKKFTGGPIYNDKFNNDAFPQWTQARKTKTGETYSPAFIVGITEALDRMSGGDGVKKGSIDINPDKLDHLLGGYLGGIYRMFAQGVDAAYKTANNVTADDENTLPIRIKDLPINSFYTSKDDLRYISDHEAQQYYEIRQDTEDALALIKKYVKNAVLSDGEISDETLESQIDNLKINREVLPLLYSRIKAIQKISQNMQYFDKESQITAEKEIAKLQRQTVDIYKKLDNIKEKDNASEYEDIEVEEFKIKE